MSMVYLRRWFSCSNRCAVRSASNRSLQSSEHSLRPQEHFLPPDHGVCTTSKHTRKRPNSRVVYCTCWRLARTCNSALLSHIGWNTWIYMSASVSMSVWLFMLYSWSQDNVVAAYRLKMTNKLEMMFHRINVKPESVWKIVWWNLTYE